MKREQPEIKHAHSSMLQTPYEKMIFMYVEAMNAHFMHFYKEHKDKLASLSALLQEKETLEGGEFQALLS